MKKGEQELRGCLSYCRAVNARPDCKNCGLSKNLIDAALNEAHQAGRDEAMVSEAYKWFDVWYEKSIDPATGMFGKWACERLQEIGAEIPRQDIIKALQDNN